jgi:hypothetical protein
LKNYHTNVLCYLCKWHFFLFGVVEIERNRKIFIVVCIKFILNYNTLWIWFYLTYEKNYDRLSIFYLLFDYWENFKLLASQNWGHNFAGNLRRSINWGVFQNRKDFSNLIKHKKIHFNLPQSTQHCSTIHFSLFWKHKT